MGKILDFKRTMLIVSALACCGIAAAQTTVVTADDVGVTWHEADTRSGGSVHFSSTPPAPPLGAASLRMDTDDSVGGPGQAKAQLMTDLFGTYLYEPPGVPNPDRPGGGLLLSDIDAISYWSWRDVSNTNPPVQVVSLNIQVDFLGNGVSFTTLVYEPVYNVASQGPVIPGVWQEWDAYEGGSAIWWSTANIPGAPSGTYHPWSAITAANPNARIVSLFGFNVGSGWSGVSLNAADGLFLGTTSEGDYLFDFEASRTVRIDVRPGSSTNQINTNAKQLVPIAILSEVDFDACTEVEIESVDVRGASPSNTTATCEDVDGDGIPDRVLRFRARDMAPPTPEECASPDPVIELTGYTSLGQPISGTDSVTWSGPACN